MIRQEEAMTKAVEIQKSLSGFNEDLLIPGRRFIKEGVLTKICRKSNKPRMFFLFSDVLIYAGISRSIVSRKVTGTSRLPFLSTSPGQTSSTYRPSSDSPDLDTTSSSFYFHRKFELDGMAIINVMDNEHVKNCFQVKSREKSFAVLCSSEKDKQSWTETLYAAIHRLSSARKTLKLDEFETSVRSYSTATSPDDCTVEETTLLSSSSHSAAYFSAPVWVSCIGK
jgi:hypothetical protein